MFKTLMIPVDLRHTAQLERALGVAAGLSTHYGADAHIVSVTQSGPTEVANTPEAFAEKLATFAADQSNVHGCSFRAHTKISHDPAIDLDTVLQDAAESIGADLIVMASHVPGFADHFFASNAGYLASHASISVLVVR
ncbi:MAG: universal stress protein [Pseudomonadota bacterium]